MLSAVVLTLYALVLTGLVGYSLHRGWLLRLSRRLAGERARPGAWSGPWPQVTVQLPIYNERFVVERLLDAVAALDYPRDRLEIQVLDDSTDETAPLARSRVEEHAARGVPMRYLRRPSREGYKAGALAWGLERARGEYVLILDADFVPPPDLLRRLLPPFRDPRVGMVQARWGHLNEEENWLTRVQALSLDAHFHFEHGARSAAGLFFNFNGTAGMWRAACIRDAGGWQADTLTEDLDLSYRAQMRGWRFVYLPDVVVPGELPRTIRAFKMQQARWARGGMQTARKVLPELLRGEWPLRIKAEAVAHLTGHLAYLLTLALTVLVVPAAIVRFHQGQSLLLLVDLALFVGGIGPLALYYAATLRASGRRPWPAVLYRFPRVLAVGIGLSVNNGRAVLLGLLDRRPAEFVRTPKRGGASGGRAYRARFSPWSTAVETVLAAYLGAGVAYALWMGIYPSLPFLLLFLSGFTAVAASSVVEPSGRSVWRRS